MLLDSQNEPVHMFPAGDFIAIQAFGNTQRSLPPSKRTVMDDQVDEIATGPGTSRCSGVWGPADLQSASLHEAALNLSNTKFLY